MPASVNYNIVGESAPFTFSVKDVNNIEKFLYINQGKIYFAATQNGTYTVTISKNDCHITNQIIVNNCESTPVVSCATSELSLVSSVDKTGTFVISGINDCTNLEFQYSFTSDFNIFYSVNSSCVSLYSLDFPQNGNYYVRVIKSCGSLRSISNVVSIVINPQVSNCYVYASCLGVGNNPNYDTFRVTLNRIASENVQFILSNGSVITVLAGDIYGQEIINVSSGCPYVVSNNLNLTYCGTVPIPPMITYYELAGCLQSDYAYTTITPNGVGQRYVLPLVTPKYYTYTGSNLIQNIAPPAYNGTIQKTNFYNC